MLYRLYYFLEDELLRVVEESIRSGKVSGALNATFITFIMKNDPESFEDYMPFSLCNSVHKILTKFLETQKRNILSEFI